MEEIRVRRRCCEVFMVRFSWSEGLLPEAIPSGEAGGTGLLAGRCLLALDLLRKRIVKALVVGASMERLSSCDGAPGSSEDRDRETGEDGV